MKSSEPQLIQFQTHGESAIGYLAVAQIQEDIPFVVKRLFWTYFTPQSVIRGGHAHHATSMVLIAVHGRIEVHTEMLDGQKTVFYWIDPMLGYGCLRSPGIPCSTATMPYNWY